jgi:glycosyltransferase involved in cell wall biosynthesis
MPQTYSILRSCFSRSWGGLEITTLETTALLRDRGHRVRLACVPESRLARAAADRDLEILPLAVTGYAHPMLAARLARELRARPVDLIHTELSRDLATLVGAIRMSGRSIPLLLTKQMGSYIMKRDLLHRITFAHVDRVLAISDVLRKNVLETTPVPPEKVTVLHHAVDTELFSPARVDRWRVRREFGIPDEAILVGFVGRFSPGKGQEELLAALQTLAPRHPRLRCLIVGEASFGEKEYEQQVRERAARLGLDGLVTFAGFRTDIPEVMATFDIFAFPSHAEAFGIVLIEAMAMERPVVSTDCDGVLEIVENGVTGVYVRPREAASLARGLEALIADPPLRARMGRAGRERVLRMFDQQKRMERLEAIYGEVLRERAAAV